MEDAFTFPAAPCFELAAGAPPVPCLAGFAATLAGRLAAPLTGAAAAGLPFAVLPLATRLPDDCV